MPSVALVVLHYTGLDDTRKCLNSIAEITTPQVRTIVVDNGSPENPSETLRREFPWCDVIRNPVNGGWAGGNNVGIRHALDGGAEYVVLLNNDTTVSSLLVDRLLTAFVANPGYGILGPVIRFMDEPDTVMTDGVTFNSPRDCGFFQRKIVPEVTAAVPPVTDVDIVNGCCMMIAAPVFEQIGVIDERFFLIHEESDFCLRALQSGFGCGVIGEALVWHKGSSSFARIGSRIQRYYDARNLHLLLRKHVGDHRGGRSRLKSWLEYWRYAYYRYCIEREHNQADSARAVVEGICDALSRRFGPWQDHPRLLLTPFRLLLEGAWRVRGKRSASQRPA